jgi:hypothetical protein
MGVRKTRFVKFKRVETPDGMEFYHTFAPHLFAVGELAPTDQIRELCIFLDLTAQSGNAELGRAVIRSVFTAIDPKLGRVEIAAMMESLGVGVLNLAQAVQELTYREFRFEVLKMTDTSFVLCVGPQNAAGHTLASLPHLVNDLRRSAR